MQLSEHLETNLAALNARLGSSADFYAKRIELYHIRGAILLFDGMASLESLWELLLDAASRQTPPLRLGALPSGEQVYELLSRHSALPAESSPVENWDDLMQRLTAGMAVLLLDGSAKGLAFSVQSLKFRSVGEPSGEGDLRGSREGFSDLLRVNLSLLRRLIRTEALVMEVQQADCAMKTEYAVCYCKDKASPAAVEQVKETLRRAKPQLLLDSSYFLPWLFPCRVRTASPVSYTERPAVASAKLCEGKIVVLVNGGAASAAELLTGILQDTAENVTVVGEKTYGKGQGQMHLPLINGDKLVITTLEMELPGQGCWEGRGLTPDIQVGNSTVSVREDALHALDTSRTMCFGEVSDNIYAMTERLQLLGLIGEPTNTFNGDVLDAVTGFCSSYDLPAAACASPEMLSALSDAISALSGKTYTLDMQMQSALEICRLAAAKPQQYTVSPDGTWKRNS